MAARFFNRIRTRLARGSNLPFLGVRVSVNVERSSGATPAAHQVFRNTLRRLVELFPDLRRYVHPTTETDPRACLAALDFVYDYLPLIHEPARETQLRRLLTRLREQVADEPYRRQLAREIAKSDVRSGVPDRATILLESAPADDEERALVRKLEADIELYERRYAARAALIRSLDVWRAIPGDVRGQSLVAYFAANPELVRGKRVLHVAPEESLRRWLGSRSRTLQIEYVTLDPFLAGVDVTEDLTALQLADDRFDLVICHRVLEHVLDDAAALRELRRVLRPGGVLNFSVPQSLSLDETNEWIIPDRSHDHHVRQYGNDLDDRLRAAGFASVTVDRFLLDRTREQHLAEGTYPLRILICTKGSG